MKNLTLRKNGSHWETSDDDTQRLLIRHAYKTIALRKTIAILKAEGGKLTGYDGDGQRRGERVYPSTFTED